MPNETEQYKGYPEIRVEIVGSGPVGPAGPPGTTVHQELSDRNAPDQHPVEAITGLAEALSTIPAPMTAEELRTILTNGGNKNA